jgi:hypothetical protein
MIRTARPPASAIVALVPCTLRCRFSMRRSKDLLSLEMIIVDVSIKMMFCKYPVDDG